MTICDQCSGKGKIHTTASLAHEEDNCMWCDPCGKCNGLGQMSDELVVISEPIKEQIDVVEPMASLAIPEKSQVNLEVRQVRVRAASILPQANLQVLPEEEPLVTPQTQGATATPATVVTQVATSAASAASMERPDSRQSFKAPSHASSVKSTLSVDSRQSTARKQSLLSLHALSQISQAEGANLTVTSEQEHWIVDTALALKSHVPDIKQSLFQIFNVKEFSKESRCQGFDMAQSLREFAVTWQSIDPKNIVAALPTAPAENVKIPERYLLKAPFDNFVASTLQVDYNTDKSIKQINHSSEADLMSHLVNPKKVDKVSLDMFIRVYRFFMTPDRLLDYLLSYFKVIPAPLATDSALTQTSKRESRISTSGQQLTTALLQAEKARPKSAAEREARKKRDYDNKMRIEYYQTAIPLIRLNSVKLLLKFIGQCWNDIQEDPNLLKKITQFADLLETGLENASATDKEVFFSESMQIKEAIRSQTLNDQVLLMAQQSQQDSVPSPSPEAAKYQNEDSSLLDEFRFQQAQYPIAKKFSAEQLATMLTLIENERWESIKIDVLLLASRSCTSAFQELPLTAYKNMVTHPFYKLAQYSAWQGFVSSWVTTSIFFGDSAQERGDCIKKFIKVAMLCKSLNNFATMSSVVNGILRQPVFRLGTSMRLVRKKYFVMLQDMVKLIELDLTADFRKFDAYQQVIMSAKPPSIPYLIPFINDLPQFSQEKGHGKAKNSIPFGALVKVASFIQTTLESRQISYRDFADLQQNVPVKSPVKQASLKSLGKTDKSPLKAGGSPLKKMFSANSVTLMQSQYFISRLDIEALESSGDIQYVKSCLNMMFKNMPKEGLNEFQYCTQFYSVMTKDVSFMTLMQLIRSSEGQSAKQIAQPVREFDELTGVVKTSAA